MPKEPCSSLYSEVTPQGITETPLGQTLLNGNNIAMVSSPFALRNDRHENDQLTRYS
jgi:hypothetical protein